MIDASENLSKRRHKIRVRTGTVTEALARQALSRHAVFGASADATREALLERSQSRRYGDGERIAARGEPMRAVLLVLSGSIELGMLSASGKRFVRWYLGPGQAQGFIPVIDGKGAIYDAHAHGETLLLLLPQAALQDAIATDPRMAQAILKGFCERSRTMHEVAASDALLPLRGRVARMILRLAETWGVPHEGGIRVSLKLSQDEFAALLAVTRQALNRELKALEAEGAIKIAYSRITVQDRDILESCSEAPAGTPALI